MAWFWNFGDGGLGFLEGTVQKGSHDSFLASLLDFVISSGKKKRLVGGIRYTYPSEKYESHLGCFTNVVDPTITRNGLD